jgi:glycosyltransferase involved in cell wall biosynthesis
MILINSARFIICTSEYEGWGHYLHEALSCKAVVLSTNGAPMCEFVTDEHCLVPVSGRHPMNLADKSLINSDDLIEKMLSLQQLTESELNEIGEANRNGFLQRSESFRQFLLTYINSLNGKVQ